MIMKYKLKKLVILGMAVASLVNFSLAGEAAGYENGMDKQAYVSSVVAPYFHPENNVKPPKVELVVPAGTKYEKIMINDVKVEHLLPLDKKNNRVVIQLHGGGYVGGLHDRYRMMGFKYAELAGGAELFSVDYRLAPQNPYPAALDDAVAAYKGILAKGYKAENIVIIGDSAGGNLALALGLYLKDNNIPEPKAMILQSPWTTLENNLPSRMENYTKDLILGKDASPLWKEIAGSSYAPASEYKNPYVSPLYGDMKGLPPMLIQTGGYEVLYDDSLEVTKKAQAAGVEVQQTIYGGMSHDFTIMIPDLPETYAVYDEIASFINRNLK